MGIVVIGDVFIDVKGIPQHHLFLEEEMPV